ncbi:DUF4236 domain-containing protein [Pseudomonas asiatica]|uniref:DUF4236 domain-containing protein n=1 Tax=Pseudomonas asiatica TaxID=2219225 RepID=UPI003340A467
MALRLRKSFKIAPGLRINVSKGGISTSIGGKGVTANIGKRGTRVTTSIPGTGLSASKLYRRKAGQPKTGASVPAWAHVASWMIIGFVLWMVFK